MKFGHQILAYWDDILSDLAAMIAIPSVSAAAEGIYPFGKAAAQAVDAAMKVAERYGLSAKNLDYYAMHAQYGEGEENAVVMAHIDVVPPGTGWDTDPYQLVLKDGKAFGRGVLDDKGSAIVALHCLRALKEAGIQGNRKLRVVLGSSEETGMGDVAYYFSKEQPPTMGFTPDGAYGVCNCEKGILSYIASCENDSPVITEFRSGTVANAVPDQASCRLLCSAQELASLRRLVQEAPDRFSMKETLEGAVLSAQGVASHASKPETGVNAASHLIDLLYKVFGSRTGSFFTHIYERIGLHYDGSRMDAALQDAESGPLTFNLGIVQADDKHCSFTVDIRYPATKDGDALAEQLRQTTCADGLSFQIRSHAKPLLVSKDSRLVSLLSEAYTAVTGEACDIYSMGGGTYAREMFGNGVAFGPEFPAHPDGIPHTANEFVHLENLKRHAQICLEAMYLMLTA